MSTLNSIDANLLLSSVKSQQKQPSSSLGKDDFLKILITQLQNQDPLNPMEDREFISQMANFSSLEQMTNLNSTMSNFVQQQKQQSMFQYSEMIGKEVTYRDDNGIENLGVVQSVRYNGTEVLLQLENGIDITTSTVFKISESKTK
ncbi:flagellar hook assembly protein FlgD [Bacillus kexueae]|uniref:flagellar hook assembly protein FlgD n=1 Tax=Aeribacillus kexueae TaxID=2078952 RepID=UPI001FAF37EC|nr:flagellar hook assembly protein FlgD [Bacillus kexueae]